MPTDLHSLTNLAIAVVASAAFLLFRVEIQRAIERFSDAFRGGPPSGPQPVPGNDNTLVLRRRKSAEN